MPTKTMDRHFDTYNYYYSNNRMQMQIQIQSLVLWVHVPYQPHIRVWKNNRDNIKIKKIKMIDWDGMGGLRFWQIVKGNWQDEEPANLECGGRYNMKKKNGTIFVWLSESVFKALSYKLHVKLQARENKKRDASDNKSRQKPIKKEIHGSNFQSFCSTFQLIILNMFCYPKT